MPLVGPQPLFQQFDGREEVVAQRDEQVDIVEVSTAAEAMGQVIARVDGSAKLAAAGTAEAEVAFDLFGERALPSQAGDRASGAVSCLPSMFQCSVLPSQEGTSGKTRRSVP